LLNFFHVQILPPTLMNPSHNSLIAVAYRTLPGAYESYPGLRKINLMP
jgi:hypothetical protein